MLSAAQYLMLPSDLRKGSETYGKWYGLELSEENKKQFYIPKGFAHGYLVLSEWAEFCYKCTDFYHPGMMAGLFGMIPKSVSLGRMSQENIRAMALLPVTA